MVFKVPSLRKITLTAPYFHNGKVTILEEAVQLMAYHQVGTELKKDEINSIIAFLKTLSDKNKT